MLNQGTTLLLWLTFLLSSCAGGCNRPKADKKVTVFAAASLAGSFGTIGKRFEASRPGVKVVFNFAGSQQLRAQMEAGAPADVFAAASVAEMDAASKKGQVIDSSVKTFATNGLAVIIPKSNPGKIATLADLGRVGVKIDVADPVVPVGRYTVQMLEAMSRDAEYGPGFRQRFDANIVSREENVKAVVSKVALGEVDAGVAYQTDAVGDKLTVIAVPERFNPVAQYRIGVTAAGGQAELAQQFVGFVMSAEGQGVLHDARFGPAEGGR